MAESSIVYEGCNAISDSNTVETGINPANGLTFIVYLAYNVGNCSDRNRR